MLTFVGALESDSREAPQEEQKRLVSGISLKQDGHLMMDGPLYRLLTPRAR
ncbi:hypothetical protein MYX65_10885 [Acidobacteria bacterium AH-259-L09]|nr:hypothetical protein [Acidobacteria bacterium AH-259-L09]